MPDLLSLAICKFVVVQLDMDTRDKGIVKSPNPVGGEEKYATIVLKGSKEAYKTVIYYCQKDKIRLQDDVLLACH